jgi:hypothetical protein
MCVWVGVCEGVCVGVRKRIRRRKRCFSYPYEENCPWEETLRGAPRKGVRSLVPGVLLVSSRFRLAFLLFRSGHLMVNISGHFWAVSCVYTRKHNVYGVLPSDGQLYKSTTQSFVL